jgi:autotransporter adhesin
MKPNVLKKSIVTSLLMVAYSVSYAQTVPQIGGTLIEKSANASSNNGNNAHILSLDPNQFTTTYCKGGTGFPGTGNDCISDDWATESILSVVTIKDGIFATSAQLAALQSTVGQLGTGTPVEYNDSTKAAITLGGAAGTTIDNLAQGALNATSMQAVNGAQLYETNQAVSALDGRVTKVEGDVTALDGRVTKVEGDVTNILSGGGVKYFHAEGGATGTDSVASGTKSVAIGQAAVASAANSVALGANSIADSVGTQVSTQTVAGVTYNVAGTTTGVVSVGAVGAERQIKNVSAGEVTFTSTDAVNGSQLFATNQRLADAGLSNIKVNDVTGGGTGSTATGSGTVAIGDGANASGGNVAIGHGSTATTPAIPVAGTTINNQYYGFAGSKPTETFSVGSADNLRQITNVGAGQLNANSTDAVNGSQLFATNQAVEGLGGRVNDLSTGLDSTRKEAFAGAAAAMAMQLPHTAPGKVSMGIGAGSYKGQTAGALSVKYTTKNNRFAVGGGVSYTGHGTGVNLAASWTFGSSEPAPMAQTGYDSSVYGLQPN